MQELVNKVVQWHEERNLIDGTDEKTQALKLVSEVGELADNACKGACIKDDIGDIMVVLVNLAERRGWTLAECLEHAYNDIKDRKGKMVNGAFVKECE